MHVALGAVTAIASQDAARSPPLRHCDDASINVQREQRGGEMMATQQASSVRAAIGLTSTAFGLQQKLHVGSCRNLSSRVVVWGNWLACSTRALGRTLPSCTRQAPAAAQQQQPPVHATAQPMADLAPPPAAATAAGALPVAHIATPLPNLRRISTPSNPSNSGR
jgi:hypothetical protein